VSFQAFAQGGRNKAKKQALPTSCLPNDVKADDVVEYREPQPNITVAGKLKQLDALCVKGKLMTKKRREIRFFRLQCWGIQPPDYQKRQADQSRRLKALKKRYAVVVIECDPRIP